jgi:hypothetical protein
VKKHPLVDHWEDVSTWWCDSHEASGDWKGDSQIILWIAYERWLNDRELLTVEDNYQWRRTPVPEGSRRLGSIL